MHRLALVLVLLSLLSGCARTEAGDLMGATITVAVVEVVARSESAGVYRVLVLTVPYSRHQSGVSPGSEYYLDVVPPVRDRGWQPGQRLVVFATGSLITAAHSQAIWEVSEQGEIKVPGGGLDAPRDLEGLQDWIRSNT